MGRSEPYVLVPLDELCFGDIDGPASAGWSACGLMIRGRAAIQ